MKPPNHPHRATPTAPYQSQVIVLYSDATDMSERAEVEKYKVASLVGQMSTFSYIPIAEGVVAGREGSCWCPPCFGVRGRGAGTADSNLCVEGCRCGATNPWREQEVQRGDVMGIAERRMVGQREGKRIAGKIEPSMWLSAQDRVTDATIWIGQGAKLPPGLGEGGCIYETVKERSKMIGGTCFTRGDIAVGVKWWVKSDGDLEERTYEEWEPTPKDIAAYGVPVLNSEINRTEYIFVVNATELRKFNFQMDALDPLPAPRSRLRRACNSAHATPARAETAGRRFRLPAEIENEILALCW